MFASYDIIYEIVPLTTTTHRWQVLIPEGDRLPLVVALHQSTIAFCSVVKEQVEVLAFVEIGPHNVVVANVRISVHEVCTIELKSILSTC